MRKKIESYIGLTEGTFKARYNNHKTTFTNVEKRNSIALSKYIWSLKDKNIGFNIKWSIIQRSVAYTNGSSRCNLRNLVKYYIICHPELATLNSYLLVTHQLQQLHISRTSTTATTYQEHINYSSHTISNTSITAAT